jgi:hypothetical protein
MAEAKAWSGKPIGNLLESSWKAAGKGRFNHQVMGIQHDVPN